ncbi:MAG: hypothetical protein QM666_11545, partial [Acinetobacter sp.]
NILQNPEQYYQCVDMAEIHFSLLSHQVIYLGDLLQLWFGYQWTEGVHQQSATQHAKLLQPVQQNFDAALYLFSIAGKSLTSGPTAQAWSVKDQKVVTLQLNDSFPYYLNFIALQRPYHLKC